MKAETSGRVQSGHDQQTELGHVRRARGEPEDQETKRPKGKKGKNGKRISIAKMAELYREGLLEEGQPSSWAGEFRTGASYS